MKVSCLLPTFNRMTQFPWLLNEALESYLRQDYKGEKELIICNDTPGQTLLFKHPEVRIINCHDRFPTLGAKIQFMIDHAEGDYICRWDDDDISLPWRLSCSMGHICGMTLHHREFNPLNQSPVRLEWRPENHWYDEAGKIYHTLHPGNTHIMAVWHRNILGTLTYPSRPCPSGHEDQTFNQYLWSRGYPRHGTVLPFADIFYLYRFGTGAQHLTANDMQQKYQEIGKAYIQQGNFTLSPYWREDHIARAADAAKQQEALTSGKQPAAV